jgi:NADPH:quinone reductase-like Zn-dependent oxidoreductase
MMKRVEFDQYGGPVVMRVSECAVPQPGRGQVQVRVMAAAINPLDWKQRKGDMKLMMGRKFPKGMGSDFSGVVMAVGDEVTSLRSGDEVFGTMSVNKPGAFSEVLVTDARLVVKKPPQLSFAEAACLPIPCATAWAAVLGKAQATRGCRILINGCTGSVGSMAVQLARLQGADVAGTCSPASMASARRSGVDPVHDYADEAAWAAAGPYDLIFDTAGTLDVGRSLRILKPSGKFIDINPTPRRLIRGALSPKYKMVFATMALNQLPGIARLAADGVLKPAIGLRRPMSEAVATIAELEGGLRVPGKAVLLNAV